MSEPTHRSTYTVRGMTCEHCVRSVVEEISEVDGILDVTVDLPTGAVSVVSEKDLSPEDVRAAVVEAGYTLAA